MSRRVFESPDLLRLIYSFGDPNHRKFTKNLQIDLQAYPEVFNEKYQETKLNHMCSYTMDEYLNEYSTDKIEWYLTTYKRCFCCARHNTNKPIISNRRFVNTKQCVFENQETACECECRALSRIFTRHLFRRSLLP